MALITKVHKLLAKLDSLRRLKNYFTSPPSHQTGTDKSPEIIKTGPGSLIGQILTCTNPYGEWENPPLTGFHSTLVSIPSIEWNMEVDEPMKTRDILNNYLCSISHCQT